MLSFFTNIFDVIGAIATFALVGALLGLACAAIGRFNYMAAAIAGAAMMVFANLSGVMTQALNDSAKQQIADLRAEKAKLEHDLAALQEVRAFEQKQDAEEEVRTKALEEQYAKVLQLIEKHKDDESCLSAEELEAIHEFK